MHFFLFDPVSDYPPDSGVWFYSVYLLRKQFLVVSRLGTPFLALSDLCAVDHKEVWCGRALSPRVCSI